MAPDNTRINAITGAQEQLNAYGKSTQEAANVARSMINAELASLGGERHPGWNKAIEAAMLAGDDPAKLFGMFNKLKAADNLIERDNGQANPMHAMYHTQHLKHLISGGEIVATNATITPDATPAVADNSPTQGPVMA